MSHNEIAKVLSALAFICGAFLFITSLVAHALCDEPEKNNCVNAALISQFIATVGAITWLIL